MRRAATAILIVLAAVLPAVAVASWWGYAQATGTARFMETAAPLATDRAVQSAVVDQLVATADAHLGEVAAVVPGGADVARTRIRAVADGLVATPAYRRAWQATLRAAHGRLAARLAGDVQAPLTLDLGRVAAVLRARVAAAGLPEVAQAIGDPAPVTVADRAQVRNARRAAAAVRIVRAFSLPAAILALVGVLLTAGSLPAGLLRVAGCLAVSTVLLLGGRAVAHALIDARDTTGGLATAVFDVLVRPLRTWIIGGAAAAAALAIAGAGLGAARRA
ncbi:MAG TPA: hypothetical protein VGO71_20120 [Baekduia sp.]|jgi:hypothetical protein|nr:hypothetical protein [Baekduia sp.]